MPRVRCGHGKPYAITPVSDDFCFDPAARLYLPLEVIGYEGLYMRPCMTTLKLGSLAVLVAGRYCFMGDCFEYAIVSPRPNAPLSFIVLLRAIVEMIWAKYVRRVRVWWFNGERYEVVVWKSKPSDVIEVECPQKDYGFTERIEIRLPLSDIRKAISVLEQEKEKVEKLDEILNDVLKEIEESIASSLRAEVKPERLLRYMLLAT